MTASPSRTQRSTPAVTLRMSIDAVVRAARWTPLLFAGDVAVNGVLALLPAVQVLTVTWLGRRMALDGHGSGGGLWAPILVTALTVCGTTLLNGLLVDVGQAQASVQHTRFLAELREAIAHMPASALADDDTATKVQAARSAVDYTMNGMADNVVRVACAAITAATLLATLWHLSWPAALLVVAALAPTTVAHSTVAGFRRRVVHEMNAHERAQRYFTDQLVYQRTATELATLGTSSRMADWADDASRRATLLVHRFTRRSAAGRTLASVATLVLVVAALAALSRTTQGLSAAVAGVLGVVSGVAAVSGTGSAVGQIMTAVPLMEVYTDVVDNSPRVEPLPPRRGCTRLVVDDLHVRHPGRSTDAVDGVSFTVRRDEMVALVGVNGAGKTSLVNALLGLVPVTEGRITLDGEDVAEMSDARRLARFALLTQEFGRYEVTVRQALQLAAPGPDATDAELWAALHRARADELVRGLPDGLDTRLGQQWGGVGISGGQWQRLALARIHLRNAGIWILDEPTSAIDAEAERQVFDELLRHRHDHITIVVSHRASTLVHMDRIHVLDAGRLVETGTHDQLMAARGPFARLFDAEAPHRDPEQSPQA